MIDKGMQNKHAHEHRHNFTIDVTVYPEIGRLQHEKSTVSTRLNKQDAFVKAIRGWIARNGHKYNGLDYVMFSLDELSFCYWCQELYDWWLDGTLGRRYEEITKGRISG